MGRWLFKIGKNLKVYVDAMLIKSRSLGDHLIGLEENFIIMKNNKVTINLVKFVFRVTTRKLLGFILTERGIEINMSKYRAILEMRSPTMAKEV